MTIVKKCTGCGRLNTEQPLGLNKKGEPYLACCPDNNYIDITVVEFLLDNIHLLHSQKWNEIVEQAKQIEMNQKYKEYHKGFKDALERK